MRECSCCHAVKAIDAYGKNRSFADGIHRRCKQCAAEGARAHRAATDGWLIRQREKRAREKLAREVERGRVAAYWASPEGIAEKSRIEAARTERRRQLGRERYAKDPAAVLARKREYRATRKDHFAEVKRRYRSAMKSDPTHVLNTRMSARMLAALKGRKAGRSWQSVVDYTLAELMTHLERQFLRGMTWENMGEWHIDHIVPVRAFDYTSPEDEGFKRAWAITNLRPLWAEDNIRKGGKILTLL